MNYSITKNGECAKHLCVIDEVNKTVSTQEIGLVFHFYGLDGWLFKTDSDCTFKTGSCCTFSTGNYCTFDTGGFCTFDTGSGCVFYTEDGCTFDIDCNCTFKTGKRCVVIDRSSSDLKPFVAPDKVEFVTDDSKLGYTMVNQKKKITIELTDEQFESLKKQGIIT